MRKYPFFTVLALGLAVVSCKKSDPVTPAVKFMSLTAGSTWNYKLTNNPSTTPVVTNYTLTATSSDSTINSKTYKIFTRSDGAANEYYNITGSDYYSFRQLPASLGGSFADILYLKDNAAVGAEWSQTFPITVSTLPINLTISSKINQKGISRTVNGVAYSDVIDVVSTISATGIPVFIPYTLTSDIHYYYAPKVGLIENNFKIDLIVTTAPPLPVVPPTHIEQKTELQSATIL